MLAEFVAVNHDAIVELSRLRVAKRMLPKATDLELTSGIPVFLKQLGSALRQARSTTAVDHEQLQVTAALHGEELLRLGLTIGQVVHDYGDVCQSVTQLVLEKNVSMSAEEFQTLNLCLDDAIAGAVTSYAGIRERAILDRGTERLGVLAHELRNLLNTALLSFDSIRTGRVAASGSTGQLHRRSLLGLRDLVDRSLADVRLDAGLRRLEPIVVADLMAEVELGALLQADVRTMHLIVTPTDRSVTIDADWQIMASALSNLLQNAFKFSKSNGTIRLTATATADRVLFDIEDECGGLVAGKSDELFRPFEQRSADRSGVGLGLAICRKAAEANGGEIRVRDLPGKGCVFTIDLPRRLTTP